MKMQTWVQSTDDGTSSSSMDSYPQDTEYNDINFTMENSGNLWWFNGTVSDDDNEDQQLVYVRIIGTDLAGLEATNSTVWWISRDARTANVERIYNLNSNQYWEVSRDVNWDIVITDANNLSDIRTIEIQFGGNNQFGIRYEVTDNYCNSLGVNIDTDKTSCNHSYVGDEMIFSVRIYSSWEIDISSYNEGLVEIKIVDRDGVSTSIFENLWTYSEEFDFTIDHIQDISGLIQGEISNASITQTGDIIRIEGWIYHTYSNTPYEGELSLSWWGLIQGENWFGSSAIEVFDGEINTTIAMPSTGGLMDFQIAFMDPWETRTIGELKLPLFIVDEQPPIILDSSIEQLSRYHLDDVGIGVNIDEDVSWTGLLDLTCMVSSTELNWDPVTISQEPSSEFQGKALFSFSFDFSNQGRPLNAFTRGTTRLLGRRI